MATTCILRKRKGSLLMCLALFVCCFESNAFVLDFQFGTTLQTIYKKHKECSQRRLLFPFHFFLSPCYSLLLNSFFVHCVYPIFSRKELGGRSRKCVMVKLLNEGNINYPHLIVKYKIAKNLIQYHKKINLVILNKISNE